MDLYQLSGISDAHATLKALGVESGGVAIMAKKMRHYYIAIKELKTPAVIILKQDALSIGAELAVPSGVILSQKPTYDCLLIANQKQMEILAQKELSQPFGLKAVAVELKRLLRSETYPIQIMGVINANEDSFFEGSRFEADGAMEKIEQMIAQGATLIDIGAVSSRPNAPLVTPTEELSRIQPLCDAIASSRLYEHATFSIDSYTPEVVAYALESGFSLINDITGASDERLIALAVKHGAKLCIMHMQGTPQTMQHNPHYEDVMVEVSDFFAERIAKCEAMGLMREDIILDVGIGFGKSLAHNLTLIKHMRHFTHFGCELLVGASRKSMIDKITPTPVAERLAGTLAIHLKAVEQGATIVRCHDVAEHQQALAVAEALK